MPITVHSTDLILVSSRAEHVGSSKFKDNHGPHVWHWVFEQPERPGLFKSGLEVLTTAAHPGLSTYHKPGTVLSASTCISYPGSGPPHWPQPQRANRGNSDRVQLTFQLWQHLSIPVPKYIPWASHYATPFLENALTQREPEKLL